ncbi:peptide-methionine (S)-S-oxide reductase [Streptomyces sp. Amel2xB2]|uniref:peptide-methionine (S)-S-oxide reductase MsrA n=1 Tax=Streptomyces sp. Amel2xB2 TaxID=1305829 RepID=UPI000DBAB362|nr:peptide-methionine (S)-S-oxide reductase MsrA [Streptomyces sp. Amel2xB2]RAJ71661.1 peptide-methionine (S)-S-oxide reductase [Streptomyces sp. Amel2xB2]
MFGDFDRRLPTPEEALPGRSEPMHSVPELHAVLGTPLSGPYPEGYDIASFALGCFWGAERRFWRTGGVWTTVAGFQGGSTPNPITEEIPGGRTGHAETVRVVFDPARVTYEELLTLFWESHDPTQGFRQGNDVGTHCRSLIFTHSPAQHALAKETRDICQRALYDAGFGDITTEILPAADFPFYAAEARHQQYLEKNPGGYCGAGGTGIRLPRPGAGRP